MTVQLDNLTLGGTITSEASAYANWLMIGQVSGSFGHVGENTGDLGVSNDFEVDGQAYFDEDIYIAVDKETQLIDGSTTAHRWTYNNGVEVLLPLILDTTNDKLTIGDSTVKAYTGAAGIYSTNTGGHSVPEIDKVALTATDAGGGILNVVNPLAVSAYVVSLEVNVTTASTGACTADFGVAATGTSNDGLIDGVDMNATGLKNNDDDAGGSGKTKLLCTSGQLITGSMATGAAAGIVGYAYITMQRI